MHRAALADDGHRLARAADGGDGEAAADRLREDREVGLDPEERLRAARPDPVARQHLVEDQHRARRAGQLAQPLEVAGARHDPAAVAHDRLGDHRGDLVAVRRERGLGGGDVVPRHDQQAVGDLAGHAGRAGHGVGRSAGPASASAGWAEKWIASDQPW